MKHTLILISCDKIQGVPAIYAQRPRIDAMVQLVTKNYKLAASAARRIAESCGADLRQLKIRSQFSGASFSDPSSHLYFDTAKILRRQKLPMEH